MSIDRHGIDTSTFTDRGRQDYARDCAEIAAQRCSQKSPYSGVFRLHCTDGYVDFRRTASVIDAEERVACYFGIPVSDVNGYHSGKNKAVMLEWLKSQGINIYDYH